jgi:tetratricopeptide (TPR) repeat protein
MEASSRNVQLDQLTVNQHKYRYDAFLSYAHEDQGTVEWLHKLLSRFWVPWKRRRRIFMDQESLSADGGLSEKLKDALRDSRFLIVCCSPDAVASEWVNLEIKEFLKSHSSKNVLACLVGAKSDSSLCVPLALCEVEQRLDDSLLKPDLQGQPEILKGQARQVATKAVLSLLAPLVNLPGKDELSDRRKKGLVLAAITLFFFVGSVVGWKMWDDRPASQINKIIAVSKSLVPVVDDEARKQWLQNLVVTGRVSEAITVAKSIDHADSRAKRVREIVEALLQVGQTEAAKSVAQEAVTIAESTDDPDSRAMVLATVAQTLAQVGQVEAAKLAAQEAVTAAKSIDAPFSRAMTLATGAQALARLGQTEAALIAAKSIAESMDIFSPGNGDGSFDALAMVAQALAQAGQAEAALTVSRSINIAGPHIEALGTVAQTLAQVGQVEAAKSAAQEADTTAKSIVHPYFRAHCLITVAQTLARLGQAEAARTAAKRIN